MEDKKNTAAETFAENIDIYENNNDVIMDLEEDEVEKVYPLRGVSIFPNTVIHFDIGREKSIRALEKAMAGDRMMFVSSQMDDKVLIPTFSDIYDMGCIVKVKQMLKINGDAVRVLVSGVCRAKVNKVVSEDVLMSCTVFELPEEIDPEVLNVEEKAHLRILTEKFIEYAALSERLNEESIDKVLSETSLRL